MNPNNLFQELRSVNDLEITWHQIIDCPTTPNFYYFLCEVKFQNITSLGTGESFLPNLAKLKSTAEALERWAIQNHHLKWKNYANQEVGEILTESSNGVAFHFTEKDAIQGAIGELIERDAVLNAYHKITRPHRLPPPTKWKFLNLINKWKYKLEDVYFILFPTAFNEYVVSCVIENTTYPYRIFGYGHSINLEKAIEKSWSEAWRFFWNLLHSPEPVVKDIEEIDSPLDHLYYHANHKINIDDIFHLQPVATTKPTSNNLKPDSIWSAQLIDYGLPGNVIRVKCETIQNLYFGKNDNQKCKIHPIG